MKLTLAVTFLCLSAAGAGAFPQAQQKPGAPAKGVGQSKAKPVADPAESLGWPQWGGPNRDFQVSAQGLADSWPAEGPRRLWMRNLGDGYSGIAASEGVLYTMYRSGSQDVEPGPGPHPMPLIVGGRGHALMAFRQVDGQEQLVAFMGRDIIGVDPNNGALLWRHPHTTQHNLAISMPVWGEGNLLFFSSSYEGGSRVLHLTRGPDRTRVKEHWHNPRVRIHFASIIRIGDAIYGSSGHSGPAFFTALDVKTGQILWQDRTLVKATFLRADGKFVILDQDGTLALATVSPQGLQFHPKRRKPG